MERRRDETSIQEKTMNTQFTSPPKPTYVNVIAWMTLASGIVNIIWGLVLTGSVVLGTFGFGLICAPLTILPTALGIFEVIFAAKLLSNPPQRVQPSPTLAVLEIVTALVGNFFSVVVGILALVFYNDITVRDYFARLNGAGPLVAVPPASPAPIVDPTPAPEEPPLPGEETPGG
jgi:hypothetical protein